MLKRKPSKDLVFLKDTRVLYLVNNELYFLLIVLSYTNIFYTQIIYYTV